MATPIVPQKQCSKCHEHKPATSEFFYRDSRGLYGFKSRCRKCLQEYDALRNDKPEVQLRSKECHIEWAKINRDRRNELQRNYYHRNIDKIKEEAKIGGKIRRKRYNEKHPELNNKTRARRAGAVGTHTNEDVKIQFKMQKGLCWWCGCKLEKRHIDHRIPLIKGGTNWPNNIVISCSHCNLSKGGKLPHEWIGKLL